MDKKFLEEVNKILLAEKDILTNKPSLDGSIDGTGDDVDEIQGKILALVQSKLSEREQDRLRKIDMALKRIEEDCFGVCGECSEDIDPKRLMFNPAFITCIACSEKLERLKKQHG